MDKLTENLNIIQNLPDQPTLSAQELKAKFDEAVGIIKNYLNEVVEPTVTGVANSAVTTTEFLDYKKEIKESIEEFNETLDGYSDKIDKAVGVATSYEDFEITTESIAYSVTQSMEKDLTATYTKAGYKPLGIIGHYYTSVYGGNSNGAYVKAIDETSITVQGHISRGNTGGTTAGNLYVNILWTKIKSE